MHCNLPIVTESLLVAYSRIFIALDPGNRFVHSRIATAVFRFANREWHVTIFYHVLYLPSHCQTK